MSSLPVFTFFNDDVLNFRCAGCGLCCQGNHIRMDLQREGKTLLRNYPELAHFISRNNRLAPLANPADGCWFFDRGSGYCGIETQYGKDAKPVMCSFFPYSVVGIHQGHFLGSLNFLCPLSDQPRSDSVYVNRANLERDLGRWDLDHLARSIITPERFSSFDLDLEQQIKDRSADHRGPYLELALKQIELYHPRADLPRIRETFERHLELWAELLDVRGTIEPERQQRADRLLATLTPLLRSKLDLPLTALPLRILAIHFYAGISLRIAPQLTPKQVMLLDEHVRVIRVLTTLERIPVLGFAARTPKTQRRDAPAELHRPLKTLERLLLKNHRNKLTLFEILRRLGLGQTSDLIRLLHSMPPNYSALQYLPAR